MVSRTPPATMTGRFQHPYAIYNATKGPMTPADLNGKRVGNDEIDIVYRDLPAPDPAKAKALLAEAGFLEGRRCAGHWAYLDLFRTHYPTVRFDESSILDLTNEPDRIITAGGVTAWQDLALHLIARLSGPEHALRTAKVYLLSGHEDGQLPFAAMGERIQTSDAVIADCQLWIREHVAVANPVAEMTERSGLTTRTFGRRFRAATGYLPIQYVHALRIERARALIEGGAEVLDDVGYQVGYEDPTFFRRLFKRKTGLSPAAYRRKVVGMMGVEA